MKGIYITEEGRKEIEQKISELERPFMEWSKEEDAYQKYANAQVYKEILSSAIILPESPNYSSIEDIITEEHGSVIRINYLHANYPDGLIITR